MKPFTKHTDTNRKTHRTRPRSILNSSAKLTEIAREAYRNRSRSMLKSSAKLTKISVCRLWMHIQRLWMAIQRLRTAVRNLQTEISITSRRLLYSRRENPHKVSSKQATALRCRLQHAATGDAMRCYGQRTALRHLAKNPASDRPACYPTDRDREAPHELCRAGLLGIYLGIEP